MRKPADPGQVPNGAEPAQAPAPRRKPRRSRPVLILVNVLIAALFLTGVYLVAEPYYLHWRQDRKTAELIKSFEEGDGSIVISAEELKVPGEEEEFVEAAEDWSDLQPTATGSGEPASASSSPGGTAPAGPTDEPYDPDSTDPANEPSAGAPTANPASGKDPAPTPKPTQPQVVIKAIGQLVIEKINLKMPIADRAEIPQLRVAVGLLGGSSMPGKPGNAIILGHRMYTYGRHFNRLDEVVTGTKVEILTKEGRRLTYSVTRQETILPADMRRVLSLATKEKQLILVTCTPVRVASHRLLVYCSQVSDVPA